MPSPSQPGAMLYTQSFASRPENVEVPHLDVRAPATSDLNYPVGKHWVDTVANAEYVLTSFSSAGGTLTANWQTTASGTGALASLTGDTGTATPTTGNIQIAGGAGVTTSASGSIVTIALSGGGQAFDSFVPDAGTNPVVPSATGSATIAGTTNQITTTGGLNSLTFSLPTTLTAPGTFTSTGALTALSTATFQSGATVSTGSLSVTSGAITSSGSITSTAGNLITTGVTNGLLMNVVTGSGAASGTVTCNGRVGSVTFTGVSIAAAADLTLTMGNTTISGASTRLNWTMSGSTTGSAPSVKSFTPSGSQAVWVVTNGTGATTTTANITFDFIVLN